MKKWTQEDERGLRELKNLHHKKSECANDLIVAFKEVGVTQLSKFDCEYILEKLPEVMSVLEQFKESS